MMSLAFNQRTASQTSQTVGYILQEIPKVSGPTYLFAYHGSPTTGLRSDTSSNSVSIEGSHTTSTNSPASDEEVRPSPPDSGRTKFRIQISPTHSGKSRRRPPTQAQRRAANVRERKRMNNLNDAFDVLRKLIPAFAYEKHRSRIETLPLAMDYIGFITDLLDVPVNAALQARV